MTHYCSTINKRRAAKKKLDCFTRLNELDLKELLINWNSERITEILTNEKDIEEVLKRTLKTSKGMRLNFREKADLFWKAVDLLRLEHIPSIHGNIILQIADLRRLDCNLTLRRSVGQQND